ncbi:LysR family transcriptional regulator [Luteimonas sp. M1R5S18]|uniref:LysR family transcriptional regulator n=1 Tax=Luteimonas rhizosphaericola TaxID=3042024 RepID=A0ABT6JEJ2_9GAMM|nr:LysR family transcriptional regulator [Luteimonas rhizosphaericola]MDH5829049.1 LysR family transcriptional regulator [Luteimonas rhizosphaericola]
MIEDIRYLIAFAKVAEAGSFSTGAKALGLSTAATSQYISRLEKSLGVPLFYRSTRRLSLTFDGAQVLQTAQEMLGLYQDGIVHLKQRPSASRKIRITIPAVLVRSDLMTQIANFIREHPDVDISISCSDTRYDIIGESFDLAFRIGELPDSSLRARQVHFLPRVVVASHALLAAYPPVAHPRDLSSLAWIGLTMRPNHRTLRHANGETCEIRYSPRIKVDSIEAAYQLTRQGLGLSAPPTFLARNELDQGVLRLVVPGWSLEPLKVHAVWPSNVPATSPVHALVKSLGHAPGPLDQSID